MGRKLTTIQRITALNAVPGADAIEVASILGWKVVVKKGEFTVGELVVYCEIDSLLPIREEFEFLRKSCYKKNDLGEGFRIRTIRLRGQISQGIAFPLSILDGFDRPKVSFGEGDDATEILGVEKYIPQIPTNIAGTVKGPFPSFMPKTDETRVQVLQDVLTRHKGMICYVTEKVDGCSVTYFVKDGEFGVCSRELELKENPENLLWKIAKEQKIEEKLRSLRKNIAIQGELIGLGIQKNTLKLRENKVLFFNAFDINKFAYYDFGAFCIVMETLGLETVPILEKDFFITDDIDALIEKSKGFSALNNKAIREGIVIRPFSEIFDLQMNQEFGNGRLSFKAVNPEYLLKFEE